LTLNFFWHFSQRNSMAMMRDDLTQMMKCSAGKIMNSQETNGSQGRNSSREGRFPTNSCRGGWLHGFFRL
jgi:hypothetical protein